VPLRLFFHLEPYAERDERRCAGADVEFPSLALAAGEQPTQKRESRGDCAEAVEMRTPDPPLAEHSHRVPLRRVRGLLDLLTSIHVAPAFLTCWFTSLVSEHGARKPLARVRCR